MSATVWGGEIKYTKRFNLGRLLSEITRNFLLLTATPHNGKMRTSSYFYRWWTPTVLKVPPVLPTRASTFRT